MTLGNDNETRDQDRARDEIARLTRDLVAVKDDNKRWEIRDRIRALSQIANRPAFLVPGRYRTLREVSPSPFGDGRSNKAHWRSVLEKRVPVPAGFRFVVRANGVVTDDTVTNGRGRAAWWEDYKGDPLPWLRELLDASEAVETSPEDRFYDRFGTYGHQGIMTFRAALALGVDADKLLEQIEVEYNKD